MKHIDWKLFKNIIIAILAWRLLLFVVGLFSNIFFTFEPSYPYFESLLKPFGPDWFVKWGGFDGVHYVTIAQKGYVGTGLIQAFFPFYPMLLRVFMYTFSPVFAAILLSTLCLVGAMYVWVIWMREKGITLSWWKLILPWLIFPTSFYFGAVYTESLFMLLVFLSLYCMDKKNILAASLFAGLASSARVVGVMLVPLLALRVLQEWWPKRKKVAVPILQLCTTLLGSVGLLSFMSYLNKTFQDPLFFLHVQEEFGAGRSDTFVLLPQVLYRYAKIFLTPHAWSWSYYAYAQELWVTLFVLAYLLYISYKHWRRMLPELAFSWGVFLMPTLTGTLQSIPRYVLAIYPLFISWVLLAKTKPKLFWALCGVSLIFLLLNVVLFLQGKWVA